jgi:hypothetical protein
MTLDHDTERAIRELLWLNPSDNLGVRHVLPQAVDREAWCDEKG